MKKSTDAITYTIENYSDLESIGKGENYPNATHTDAWPLDGDYVLLNDIDCQNNAFSQIAPDEEEPFSGSLDGQGFTISNISGSNGIFGYIDKGKVENLNLSSINIKTDSDYQGIVLRKGLFQGFSDVTLTNSSIENNANYTGLIAGSINVLSSNVYITNSSIMGSDYTGGIAGEVISAFTNLYVSNITVNGNDYVGGVVGRYYVTDGIGQISVDGSIISGRDFVGGLMGVLEGAFLINISASNASVISGRNYVGGLVGSSEADASSQSYSTSTVISNGGSHVGGLYGHVNSPNAYNALYFSGNLSAGIAATDVGRFIGSSDTVPTLTSAYYYENQHFSAPVENVIESTEIASNDNFTDPHWYADTLGFSTSSWDFISSPLSPLNGPKVKDS